MQVGCILNEVEFSYILVAFTSDVWISKLLIIIVTTTPQCWVYNYI